MNSSGTRVKWRNNFDFLFVTMGCAIGLGNLWRFPYLCYKHGGGIFLIPYFVTLLLIGLPALILQTSLGQYKNLSLINSWTIVPVMKGIGYASLVSAVLGNIVYGSIIAWSLRYFVASFSLIFPWTNCKNEWNTARCLDISQNVTANFTGNQTVIKSPSVEYWEKSVLNMTSGIHDIGMLKIDMVLCVLATWAIAYICVCKSINVTSKIAYVTATLPFVMLVAICVNSLTMEGAVKGITYFVKPNVTKLLVPQVWKDAVLQNLFSLTIPDGVMVTLGGYNSYHHNFYRDAIALCVANSFTSILSGFAVFSTLGFMATQQNVSIDVVAESGPGLAFIVYPQALSMMPGSHFWAAMFFLMLFLLGLDSLFAYIEGVVAAISEIFPCTQSIPHSRSVLGFLTSLVCALVGLITATNSIAISWMYGLDRYYDHMCDMLTFKPRLPWFKYCWKYISPMLCTGMFIYCLILYEPLSYNNNYIFPGWSIAIGWIISLSSTSFIPGYAIYYTITRWKKAKNAGEFEISEIEESRTEELKHFPLV